MHHITRLLLALVFSLGLFLASIDSTEAAELETVPTVLDSFNFPAPKSQCPSYSDGWKTDRSFQEFYERSIEEAKQQGTCLTQEARSNMQAISKLLKDNQLIVENIDTESWISWNISPKITRPDWNDDCDRGDTPCRLKFWSLNKKFKPLRKQVHSIAKTQQTIFLEQFELVVETAIVPSLKKNDPEFFEKNGIEAFLKSMSESMQRHSMYDTEEE